MENVKFKEWIKEFKEDTQKNILNIVNDNLQEYNIMCKHEGIEECKLSLNELEVSEMFVLGIYSSDYYCIKYVDSCDRILVIISINIFNENVKNVLTN